MSVGFKISLFMSSYTQKNDVLEDNS
jgi:hypothetical protein